jgi:hypothetical protein
LKEFAYFVSKIAVTSGLNCCFVIEYVDIAGPMGYDGDPLVFQGTSGFGGKFGSIEPHGFSHYPPVICNYSITDIQKILRVQRCSHHEDIFQRNFCYHK